MSWQAYVDSSLVGTGHLDKAAIVSAAGDSVWATSSGFTVSPSEMQNVVKALGGGSAQDTLWTEGLHIAGEKYVVNKAEDRSIYGRKGREGIIISKTTQAILIAHYGENAIAGNAASTVESLADYLIKLGY
ncbi:MAG: profilin, required for normal timing of actin polymerization in response to thermal stress [Claussenomyces sp. TS43310]|nr:MAG: profilin, required for normal timing of actin polymerization in response to thermal stress [Claussenomyces sp. TS43310]